MLPYSYHAPPLLLQQPVGVAISRLVGCELLSPPRRVGMRPPTMLGTAVPKAAVDEHGHFAAGKSDVDGASPLTRHRVDHAVAQTSGVQRSSQRDLRPCVSTVLPAHPGRDG